MMKQPLRLTVEVDGKAVSRFDSEGKDPRAERKLEAHQRAKEFWAQRLREANAE